MKYNPVQNGKNTIGASGTKLSAIKSEYYEKMQEFVPMIEELDDEIVDNEFFQRKKVECMEIEDEATYDNSFLDLPLVKKIKDIGFSDAALTTIATYDPY